MPLPHRLIASGVLGGVSTMSYTEQIKYLFAGNIVANWRMNELTGTTMVDDGGGGYNGTYSNVTLAQLAIGGGDLCPYFNGTTSYANIYSAGFAGAFNNQEGTAIITAKVPSTTWPGPTSSMIEIRADATNRIILKKYNNNYLEFGMLAAGSGTDLLVACTDTNIMSIALTWSKAANKAYGYINGIQACTGVYPTWVGALDSDHCCVGSSSTVPDAEFPGYLGHMTILNRPATQPELAQVAAF